MALPWPSFILLVVPPVVIFLLVLVHWLRAPREERPAPEPGKHDSGRSEA